MSDVVISVEALSKQYRLGQIGSGSLKADINRGWARLRGRPDPTMKIDQTESGKQPDGIIWALRNVSFEVGQGEIIGIIGSNGAGKSTLLKILSRTTAPTSGFVRLKGDLASLLEVGTGFHPELTGRENIYQNGALLGMRRSDIDRKFAEIVAFSEIQKFLDTPVKRYSSGMYVRLAFAVAAHLEPAILLVDEVLAVGDVAFQKKCLGQMERVAKAGRTVLFVSHNMGAVRSLCGRAIWLEQGRVRKTGAVGELIRDYEEALSGSAPESACEASRNPEDIKGRRVHFTRVEQANVEGRPTSGFRYGESLVLNVSLGGDEVPGGAFSAEFYIYNELGVLVCVGGSGTYHGNYFSSHVKRLRIAVGPLTITSGRYRIRLSIMAGYERIDTWESAIGFVITECRPFRTHWEIPTHREGVCVLQQSFEAIG